MLNKSISLEETGKQMSQLQNPEITYCYRHPNRETTLRCNQCGKFICPECAIHTPTGYRCRECVRSQQKAYDNTKPMDLVWAVVISGVIAFLGSLLVSVLGVFTLFLAPGVGVVIAEVVRKVINKRRSRNLYKIVAITCVAGGLPVLGIKIFSMVFGLTNGSSFWFLFWGPLWMVYYIITMTTSAYYRLSGMELLHRK